MTAAQLREGSAHKAAMLAFMTNVSKLQRGPGFYKRMNEVFNVKFKKENVSGK